jgi:hypothetical protein
MQKLIKTMDEGLDQVEIIDKQISEFLEKEDYGSIIGILKDRLVVISQMNLIKEKGGISPKVERRIQEVFEGGNNVQKAIQEKKNKIGELLKKRRMIVTQNKKIRY